MTNTNELEIELPCHKLRILVENGETIGQIRKKFEQALDPNHPDFSHLKCLAVKVFPNLPVTVYKCTLLSDTVQASSLIDYKLTSASTAEIYVVVADARKDRSNPVQHYFKIVVSPTGTVADAKLKILQEVQNQNIATELSMKDLHFNLGAEHDEELISSLIEYNPYFAISTILGNPEERTISVKTLTGRTVNLSLPLGSCIYDVKLLLETTQGIPPAQQMYLLKGEKIHDNEPISSVPHDEHLCMVMYLRGDSSSVGLAVGGAKDITVFRKKIAAKKVPARSDLTYEGLFYQYSFDTGGQHTNNTNSNNLFYTECSQAVSTNPVTGKVEHYLKIGLNSNVNQSKFSRKKLRLTIVLDISGSMSRPFDPQYINHLTGAQVSVPTQERGSSKLQVALQTIVNLMDLLNDDDYMGLVLFDDESYVALPLQKVNTTKFPLLKQAIMSLHTGGATDWSKGMKLATTQYAQFASESKHIAAEYENRILFLTDDMPSWGETPLWPMVDDNATAKNYGIPIYTTVVGVGVDFATLFVEAIAKSRGANYLNVHSSREFKERLQDNFEYLVSPLVFDFKLKLKGNGVSIDQVYGSPKASESNGEIITVPTLFASKRENEETRGGVILVKLKYDEQSTGEQEISLEATFEEAGSGQIGREEHKVKLLSTESTHEPCDDNGCRKAVALVRYASFLKNLIASRSQGELSLNQQEKEDVQKLIAMLESEIEEDQSLMKEVLVLQSMLT